MSDRPLSRRLARHHARLRRAVILRHALRAAAAIAVLLAIAVGVGAMLPPSPATAGARLSLVVLAALAALVLAARRVARGTPGFDAWLEQIEQRFPEVRSWLRNALDLESAPPADTSPELAGALHEETARRIVPLPLDALAPPVRPARPAGAIAAALLAIVLLAIAMPAAMTRSWSTLWNPAAAAPPVELAVEPGSVKVTPGASLAVRASVRGTAHAPRLERGGARAPEAVDEGPGTDGARRWRFDLVQLTRAENYRVRVASVASPLYRISLDGAPAPLSFDVEYRAPAYARLPVQRGSSTRGDLAALAGSRARIEVTFDRDLDALAVRAPDGRSAAFSALTPRRWRGELPVTEGRWTLEARAAGGTASFGYPSHPVPDQPPVIAVRTPEGDVDLPAGQQVPVAILGQDDLGLARLRLESRRAPDAPWKPVPLASFEREPREAEVATRWDAAPLGLLPGESASFRFVLEDNNTVSGPGRAVSPAFELRFPSLAELYERTDETQHRVQGTLERAADRAKELQKSLEKMERQQAIRTEPQSSPAFERSEEMKRALERQQDLARQLDDAAQSLRQSVEEAAERKAFDQELLRKLKEMADLMQQIQSPELRQAMEKMQQALQNMDPRAMEQNLPQWREHNQELLENLERSIELLKRLREEEKLASLAQRADELKQRQDDLNARHEQAPEPSPTEAERKESNERAGEQQKASEESEQLASEVKETAQKMDDPAEREQLEKAASEIGEQAASEQREASESAKSQPRNAAKAGKQASQHLSSASQRMSQMSEQRRQQRQSADLAAVRRSAQDLVAIERENSSNLRSTQPGSQRADRQTDLAEGVARVSDSLATLAGRTPFLSGEVGTQLGRAFLNLQNSGRDLSAGNRQRGEQSGRDAGEALNQVVLELRATEESMCSMPGQNDGQTKSTGDRMGELSEKQSRLNQETRSVSRRLSEQMTQAMGDPQELQRLAEEQSRIRAQLEQIQRDDQGEQKLLGRLDQTRREMQEVEEALRAGSPGDDLEEKQQHILSRMLDAQRSVHRRDFDPQRESRPGEMAARPSPADLPPGMLRESDRLRLGLLRADADRYPPQYRALVETYLRSLNEKKP